MKMFTLLSPRIFRAFICSFFVAIGIFTYTACASTPTTAPDNDKALAAAEEKSADINSDKNSTTKVENSASEPTQAITDSLPLAQYCFDELDKLPGPINSDDLKEVCKEAKQDLNCESTKHSPIFHYDRIGTDKHHGKKILAISLIHGDETPSGSVIRAWMVRLRKIDPRNTWRVIPIVNPDGLKSNTRFNFNKVDLNRNFPSADWDHQAIKYWTKTTKKDPRRYPGMSAASELETKCLVQHIEEFKPDFIISVHTPLGVLDFDGPRLGNPGFKPLPWVGLGNYAGSLGRYMWVDNKIPVLTIELKGNIGLKKLEDFDKLQDVSGTVAIQASRILEAKSSKKDTKKSKKK